MQLHTPEGISFTFDLTGLTLAWSFGPDAYLDGLTRLEERQVPLADKDSQMSLRFRKEQTPEAWAYPHRNIFEWCKANPVEVANQIRAGLLASGVSAETADAMQLDRVVAASTQPNGRLSAYDLTMSIVLAETRAFETREGFPIRHVTGLMSSGDGVNFASSEVVMFSQNPEPSEFVMIYQPLAPVLASAVAGVLADLIFTADHHRGRPSETETAESIHAFLTQWNALLERRSPEDFEYGAAARHLEVQRTLTRNLLRAHIGHEVRHMCAAHRTPEPEQQKRTEQEADVDGLALAVFLARAAHEALELPYGITTYFTFAEALAGQARAESDESTYPTTHERRRLTAAALSQVQGVDYDAYRDLDAAITNVAPAILECYRQVHLGGVVRTS